MKNMFHFRKLLNPKRSFIRKKGQLGACLMGALLLASFKGQPTPSAGYAASITAPPDSMSMVDHELKELLLRELRLKQLKDSLVNFALHFEGKPYRYGGKSPQGFDCSGFVQYVFSHFEMELDRTSRAQSKQGQPIDPEQLKKGDLLFFTGTNKQNRKVGHVGIVISKPYENVRFIHASSNGGVKISELNGYYQTRFLFARQVL